MISFLVVELRVLQATLTNAFVFTTLAAVDGFEPPNICSKSRCLTTWLNGYVEEKSDFSS
jgi:hypothetical protein